VEWLICCNAELEYQLEAIIIVGGLTLYLTQADIYPSLSYNKVPLHRIDQLKKTRSSFLNPPPSLPLKTHTETSYFNIKIIIIKRKGKP